MRDVKRVRRADMMRRKLGFYIGLIGLGCLVLVHPALAIMQDKETCKALRSARTHILSSGILNDMAKGPEWVKDNLAPEQIERIKLYLILDATVAFQCPGSGGPAIKGKKTGSDQKKAGTRKVRPKKKINRKKRASRKKKTSKFSYETNDPAGRTWSVYGPP